MEQFPIRASAAPSQRPPDRSWQTRRPVTRTRREARRTPPLPARKYCCGLLCGSVSQTRVTVNWLVIFPSHRAGGYGRRRCLAPCAGQDINRRGKTLKCVSAKQLPQDHEKPIRINDADVAELVDARDLKSLDGNVVRVRVPPPAPVKSDIFSHFQAQELSRSVRRVSDKSATGPPRRSAEAPPVRYQAPLHWACHTPISARPW